MDGVTFMLGVGLILAGLVTGFVGYMEADWVLALIAAVLGFLGIGLLWVER